MVFAFGSPLDFRFSVSSGVVSGLGRDTRDAAELQSAAFENFIQIDAPINPGSSGGPVTDHRGHVIGMSTAIAANPTAEDAEDRFSGVALAVPMDMIEAVVPQLLADGRVRRGYLGVGILDTHRSIAALVGPVPMEGGVLITNIKPASSLATAGLRSGDLIWRIDDAPATLDAVHAWLRSDDEAVLAASHILDGDPWEPRTIQCQPGSATAMPPSTPLHAILPTEHAPPAGVIVSAPVEGGPAAKAGLLRGDIITAIGGRPTRSVDQLRAIVSSLPPRAVVEVSFWRPDLDANAGSARTATITLADRSERFDP